METRCLFGVFVFGSNSALIYRFLTKDLFAHLHQRFLDRGYRFEAENGELSLSIDDAIVQHFSILINLYAQTSERHSAIRHISLDSGIEIFFDQIGESNVIAMADSSFHSLVVLKVIHLLKALIKFHMGALPFTDKTFKITSQLIDRISASLQFFLNHVSTEQALIFESCEYLHINPIVRQQCSDACLRIQQDIQASSATVVLICNDKIVHLQTKQTSNSDLFLLLLNNSSRNLRDQFETRPNSASTILAHTYTPKKTLGETPPALVRRAHSLPTYPELQAVSEKHWIELVFMTKPDRTLAPFTLCTVPLTENISVLMLLEWKTSAACSNLSNLMSRLHLCLHQGRFPFAELNTRLKLVENSPVVRRYCNDRNLSPTTLSTLLTKAQTLNKSSTKQRTDMVDHNDRKGRSVLVHLMDISRSLNDMFQALFFESIEYTPPESLIELLRQKLSVQLQDWFSFIEIKSQRNITMSLSVPIDLQALNDLVFSFSCHNEFPGLVHFVFIDRLHGRICTPALAVGSEHRLEKKIIAFEFECLAALQRGCTSYTMTDEHFTYNYTLRLQESNGASMRVYKPFVKSQPPGILHFDFYRELAKENYPELIDQTTIACFELICMHLHVVPGNSIREQCEQLWPRLMQLDEQ